AAELEAMIEKFQVKTELVDRVIEACQSYFSWQYDTVEAAQKAASEVLSLPTGTPSLPFKLRLMEPFSDVEWLNAADKAERDRLRRRAVEMEREDAERARAKEAEKKKGGWLNTPEGQAWKAKKIAAGEWQGK
ncbi:UNVERIFIED_CONTAM: hypothetical protein RF648_18960, partial [Kocuria sp. CPCC 205274]